MDERTRLEEKIQKLDRVYNQANLDYSQYKAQRKDLMLQLGKLGKNQ